jgi:serine/threonine protein kinase
MSLENQYQQTVKTKQCPSCGVFVDPSLSVCPNDGTSLIERFDKDPTFVNYEFLGTIGSGGMGVIYKARQVILNKIVAIKTLHPHLSSPAAFRRFQIEGQATSLLKHPFIIAVHDFGITKSGQTFMVMDFVDGETLDSLLRRIGQLDAEHFLNIFIDVCDALAHAHSRSVIHRDIKSSNIMIVKGDHGKEEIRIMDFGIAKLVADTESSASQLTRTGEVIGTATCMSPEQARGGKVDHRSDLYALGCVMYECLATSPPFVGNNPLETMLMHLEKKPVPIKEASMGHAVDPRIEKIIFCLLEKDPDHRYQSMTDLKHDLQNLRNTLFSGEKAAEFRMPKKEIERSQKSWRVPVIAGSISMVLLAGTALVFFLLKSQPQTIQNKTVSNPPATVSKTESSAGTSAGASKTEPSAETRAGASKAGLESQDSKLGAIFGMASNQSYVKTGLETKLQHGDYRVSAFAEIVEGISPSVSDDDLTAFKGKHPETRVVDLSHADKITDKGLSNLSGLELTELYLKDSGARDLDWILSQPELKQLYISGSKLTPKAFQNIGKLKHLEELDIARTNFRDSDIDSISGLVNLQKLVVEDNPVSIFGYDKLLNTFRKAINIPYSPPVVKGSDCLTGSLSSIENNLTVEELFDKAQKAFGAAQQAMTQSAWQTADTALERVNLRITRDMRHHKPIPSDINFLVTAGGMRGDCLRRLNLPYAAVYVYSQTANYLIAYKFPEAFVADMRQRSASVHESLSADPAALGQAIWDRTEAESILKGLVVDTASADMRNRNLESLQRDEAKSRLHKSGQ